MNALGALADRLSKGNVFEDEREYVEKLGTLLLALIVTLRFVLLSIIFLLF